MSPFTEEVSQKWPQQCMRCFGWLKSDIPHVCDPPNYAPETRPSINEIDDMIAEHDRYFNKAKWVVAGMIIVYIAVWLYSII